jgi:threonine dehydratase
VSTSPVRAPRVGELGLDAIRAARERIADALVQTPCTESLVFGDLVPGHLHVKLENLQRTGSFKERGSLNKMLQLDARQRARGVVTASAGNHAQAVAYHAQRLGIAATVVMPENTPLIKVSNTERYHARVVLRGSIFDDAAVEAERLEREEGLVMIHPFDDVEVMAGQGTIGLEILEQVPEVDLVVVPVGGGGLISGIAVAIKSLRPQVRVIGVESAAAPSARASRDAGRVVRIEHADTIADGIATKQIGELTFGHIERWVDDLVVVSEEEIATAILLLLEREKTVAEGAGAAPAAALLNGRVPLAPDQTTVFVLSGGNIDVNRISRIIHRGLIADGRLIQLRVRMQDRPGSLARLAAAVASQGGNVVEIVHVRGFADISVGDVDLVMQLETRGRDHAQAIIRALEAQGLAVEEEV